MELFVRKNKDDKISKEFYYLGRMTATGKAEEFVMANTDKTAVEIEWQLDTPVREDIYEYIVNIEVIHFSTKINKKITIKKLKNFIK